ncbi:MAG: Gfo/Idh/MocA family oxidoreductase [Pseudomonadota bacterium]
MTIRRLAVIGGGRWGRVHQTVAAAAGVAQLVTVARAGDYPTIDALLETPPDAAIIANAARLHGATAMRLVQAGVPVLIEKPAAYTVQEAEALIALSTTRHCVVMPGLNFLYCRYLTRFAQQLGAKGCIRAVALRWDDESDETRYGEAKRYDAGVSIAMDIMPHIWSILTMLDGSLPWQIDRCTLARGGRDAMFALTAGDINATVSLAREAKKRVRQAVITTGNGETISLDFTIEPGHITHAGGSEDADPQWREEPSPLALQWRVFEQHVAANGWAASHASLRDSVAFTVAADAKLQQARDAALKSGMAGMQECDARYMLRDALAGPLWQAAYYEAGDNAALNGYASSLIEKKAAWPLGNEQELLHMLQKATP